VRATVRSLQREPGVRAMLRDAGVTRVVFTSTCGAIYSGHPPQQAPFDGTSWTNVEGEMSAYVRSKAIAERAVWDFMAAEGGRLELSVINPAGIFRPVLGADYSSSIELVKRLMNGMPGCPRLYFGVVDVRDVADLHVRAARRWSTPVSDNCYRCSARSGTSPARRPNVSSTGRHGRGRTPSSPPRRASSGSVWSAPDGPRTPRRARRAAIG
jgi:3-beta hydroxysteroid dehydrogenase/isomerase family protein